MPTDCLSDKPTKLLLLVDTLRSNPADSSRLGCPAGMDSVPSEDNLADVKAQSSSHLDVQANASRAWSSDDLRSMGAPLTGPSGLLTPRKLL